MNITATCSYDERILKRFVGKVYDRIARVGLLLTFILSALGLIQVVQGMASDSRPQLLWLFFGIFMLVFYWVRRSAYQRMIATRVRRQVGGAAATTVTLTDEAFEFQGGETLIRTRWQDLGTHYLFLGGGFAVMEERNPTLFVPSLSELGVEAAELKEILTRAGLKDFRTFRGRWWIVLIGALFGGAMGALSSFSSFTRPCPASAVEAYDDDDTEDEEDADEEERPFSLGDIDFEKRSLSLDYMVSSVRSPTNKGKISYQDLANVVAVLRQQKDPKRIDLMLEIADVTDAARPLETLATLTNANFTIDLWLFRCSNLVDVAVLGEMPLRKLTLSLEGDSLRAVRGLAHCPLEHLEIQGEGISSLSDIDPLPHLKQLTVQRATLAEPTREELKARFPELDLAHFVVDGKTKTIPLFSETARFAEAVKDADRVVIRNIMRTGPEDYDQAPVLVTLTDSAEIAAFRASFRFQDKGKFFDCFCSGNPLIEWWRGDVRLARTAIHHLKGLKWDRFYGAAYFTPEAQAELRAWFDAHQIECE